MLAAKSLQIVNTVPAINETGTMLIAGGCPIRNGGPQFVIGSLGSRPRGCLLDVADFAALVLRLRALLYAASAGPRDDILSNAVVYRLGFRIRLHAEDLGQELAASAIDLQYLGVLAELSMTDH
jgi:hypothetical protein